MLKTSIFDRKFGFYVKNNRQSRLESSQILNPGPTMTNMIFQLLFYQTPHPQKRTLEEDNQRRLARDRRLSLAKKKEVENLVKIQGLS